MNNLLFLLLSWPVVGFVVYSVVFSNRTQSVGLPLAYLVGFALLHWPGAALYLDEGYFYYQPDIVLSGFRLTTYGLWAFCLGIIVMRLLDNKQFTGSVVVAKKFPHAYAGEIKKMAIVFVGIGLFAQLIVIPLMGPIATVTALVSGLSSLSIVGVCLGLWDAMLVRDRRLFIKWLLLAFSFPLITLMHSAFLGFGVAKLIAIIAFVSSFKRARLKHVVLMLIIAYLGLSLFVTYFRDRTELRNLVWTQGADYSERIDHIWGMFQNFELFDPDNDIHLFAIDERLNQNHLIGRAINYINMGGAEYAKGKTIWFAFVALIPRAVWPDKPAVGGGGSMVSDYTGIIFAQGTSVGSGQVFEFYINFGVIGVVIGFFVFGIIITLFDGRAAMALVSGDYRLFVMWFLPGIGLLQAGGNLVELVTTVGAAIGSALVAIVIIRRYLRKPVSIKLREAVKRGF